MTTAWLLALLPLVAVAAAAPDVLAIGDRLPRLRGDYLTGRTATLPEAAEGRVALLLLGFTYDSRHAVEAWAGKFRNRYDANPRVTFYEIPIIGGMARLGKWFIDSGMRSGTPKADYEHVITVYGGAEPWKRRAEYRDPKAAYLILLDPAGKVAWRYSGAFDEAAFRDLSARIDQLLAGNGTAALR